MRAARGLGGATLACAGALDGGRRLEDRTVLRSAGLYPYQVEGVRWLQERLAEGRGALLADEMGLGKTVQALRALPELARAIVLCPASVRVVWRDATARWRPDLLPTVIREGERVRAPHVGEVVIGSYESLPAAPLGSTRALLLGPTAAWLRDAIIICDEAQYLKEPNALRTQRARLLGRQSRALWGISGTPLLGKPTDLQGVLQSIELFLEAFPGGPKEFAAQYQAKVRHPKAPRHVRTQWGAPLADTPAKLARVMLRRLRADVLPDLPGKRYLDLPIEAPADLTAYLDAQSAAWDAWRDAVCADEGEELPPFELLSGARAALARSRAAAAVSWVWEALEASDASFLVFSAHVDPILAVARVPGVVVVTGETSDADRARAVARFQSGEPDARCFAATIATGGLGLTLTRANRVLFVDRDYTPANNAQAEDRAARIGSTHRSIDVVRMVSDHPLDRRLAAILDAKQELIRGSLG